jgi:hypothetical protein
MRYASSRVGECSHRGSDPTLEAPITATLRGSKNGARGERVTGRRDSGSGLGAAYQTLKPGTFIGDVMTSPKRTGP